MARLPVLLVVLAALILGTVGWLASTGSPAAPNEIRRQQERDIMAAAADDAPLGIAEAPVETQEPNDPVSREEATPLDPNDTVSQGGFVQVVNRENLPVAGAVIRWITADRLGPLRRQAAHTADVVDLHGTPGGTTDRDGRAPLPPFERRLYLTAALGETYAYRAVRASEGSEVVLQLAPDSQLDLTVVDGLGNGVEGVPLFIQQASNRTWRRIRTATSQGDGQVPIRHIQLHSRRFRNGDRNQFRVQFGFPNSQPAPLEFNLPHRGEATLVMPPTAPLFIAVVGPGNVEFATPATVLLTAKGLPEGLGDRNHRLRMGAWAGAVEFPFVETGLTFDVSVQPRDRDLSWSIEAVAGPVVAGQAESLRVDSPPWLGTVAGTLVDGDQPVAAAGLELLLTGGMGRIEGERVTTNEEGQFEMPFRQGESTVAPFELQAVLRGQPARGGRVRAAGCAGGRRVDVGDVPVDLLPAFATGIAVNDLGEPIRGARIQLLRSDGGDGWAQEQGSGTRSAEDGTFAIYADPAPGRLIVEASARGHRRDRSADVGRTSEVRLILSRTATLRGVGQAPRWLPENALSLEITDSRGERVWNSLTVRGERLSFRTRELDPGDFRLALMLRGFPTPLADLGSLWVEPGLQRIELPDIRNSVYRYRLRATRSDGQPMRDPRAPLVARVTGFDGTEVVTGFPWAGRRLELFSASSSMPVTMLGLGYRPQDVTLLPGETTLVFEPLQPAMLTVAGARSMAGPGQRVRVSMVYTGETNLPAGMRTRDQNSGDNRGYSRAQLAKSGGAWLPDDGDTVSIPLMLDGEYAVVLRFHGKGQPVSHRVGTVTVRLDGNQPAAVSVPANPEQIRAALVELAGR